MKGTIYTSDFGGHRARHRVRRDGQLGIAPLDDGSLIVPESDAPQQIRSRLAKSGLAESEIEQAISRWKSAPSGVNVDLGEDLIVRNWYEHQSLPEYSESSLNPLLPLKIAYEFTCLIVGGGIYASGNRLAEIRKILNEEDGELSRRYVKVYLAPKGAFHGIAFQGNRPSAEFLIRLFGSRAYVVKFENVHICQKPVVYTHCLETNKEYWQ